MKNFNKTKVLFVIDSLRSGGISSSLSKILKEIDYSFYDVTLVVFHWESSYSVLIPDSVSVKHFEGLLSFMNATSMESMKNGFFNFLIKKVMAVLCFVFGSNFIYTRLFKKMKTKIKCDIGISYTNNLSNHSTYFGSNKFLIEKVDAKVKCSWLHVDYEKFKLNKRINNAEYRKMNYVIAVSEAVKKTFISYLPELEKKCCVFYNSIDEQYTEELAKEEVEFLPLMHTCDIKIISIGRLDKNKNLIDCLKICKLLKKRNVSFVWLVLGDGPERKRLSIFIKRNRLEKNCFLIGHQRNPYSFLSKVDLLVSTSKTESFGLVVLEAQALNVLPLIIDYPAAKEIIANGENGFIFFTKEEIANFIVALSQKREKLLDLKNNCKISLGRRDINEFIESLYAQY